MRIEPEVKLGFKDVMFRPKRSTLKSRSEVSLERTFKFLHSGTEWTGVPVMPANMDTVATFGMAKALVKEKILTPMHKHYSVEEWNEFLATLDDEDFDYIAISTGTSEADYEKVQAVFKANPKMRFICIDIANGYSEHLVEFVRKMRQTFKDKVIIAGNVVTGEMTEELLISGADIVKVGIGPGSVCTTRVKTGVGYPQVSAVIECADYAHGLSGLIISDGGCTAPGDVSKAFGAGADFVMMGGMMAGHQESGGEIIEQNGKKFVKYYGMSSKSAMNKHSGGVAQYRASEGKTVHVPYKGSIKDALQDILGGVRSTCTYVGARRLRELSKRTTFIRVMEQHNQVYGDEQVDYSDRYVD